MNYNYDEIRYYNDNDFKKVILELAEEPTMYRILRYYKGISDAEEAKKFLLGFKNIKEFQLSFIINLMQKIIDDSISDLSFDGLEHLEKGKKYLFLTNHRNIVMDVATLNYVLYKHFKKDFQSTAIAIGNNLLSIPWVQHLARINKSFLVERGLNPQQMLLSSKRLSAYIRENISQGVNSVWLANREGRAKDGNDFTQAGLIKMLTMSAKGVFAENIGELHIVPVAISYENDPCDIYKVSELAAKENNIKYEKAPMEDFNSMFAGLMGQKGRVHFQFGKELTKDILLKINENAPVNMKVRNLCDYLDNFYFSHYRLFENNYIAADLLNNQHCFSHLYSQQQYDSFVTEMEEKLQQTSGDMEQNRRIFLKMTANPTKNYYSTIDSDYKFNF